MRNKNVFIPAVAGITLILTTMLFAGENPMDLIKKNQGLGKELGIKLDGKLTEPLWQKAKKYEPFYSAGYYAVSPEGTPAPVQTTTLFAYDNFYLYFGFICQEPNITNLTQKAKVNDLSRIYGDDSIEVEIDSNRGGRYGFYRIAVNSLGNKGAYFYCGYGASIKVEIDCFAGASIEKDRWIVEMAVPFSSLVRAGGLSEEIGIVFARNRVAGQATGGKRSESFSTKTFFHNPANFHIVSLAGVEREPYLLSINPQTIFPEVSHLIQRRGFLEGALIYSIRNDSLKSRTLVIEGALSRQTTVRPPEQGIHHEISLSSNEEKRISSPISLAEPGQYDFLLFVKENGRLIANITYPLKIAYNPLILDVISPFYRNSIYATQKNIDEIEARVKIGLSLEEIKGAEVSLILQNDKEETVASKKLIISKADETLSLPIPSLPTGKYTLKALIQQKEVILAQTVQTIKKLPYKKGEVWLDEDLNWHMDGKPFFLLGRYGYDKNPYYTLYHQMNQLDLSEQERGIKRSAASTARGNWALSKEDIQAIKEGKINNEILSRFKEIVKKEKDKPDLFCYFLCDEPECGPWPVESMKALYEAIREEDPYHPIWLVSSMTDSARTYADCADFALLDIYPIFEKNKVADSSIIIPRIEDYLKFTNYRKPVGFMHEGFNYSDAGFGERAPTYIELRDQNLLAITVGGKNIIQFNFDVGFGDYPEYDIGIPHLTQELAYLGKTVMAPVSKLEVKTSSDKVRTLLKDVQGELYLFAVNAESTPRNVRITIPGISKRAKDLNVISEGRAVGIKEDTFTDKFDTFEAHVYTTSKEETGLMSVAEVCKKIETVQQARKKPGNLAFQMYKGDGVTVTASSGGGPRLWHLVDGIMNSKRTIWVDKTPNEYPDWIEIKLPGAHSIGRVVVYPYDKSLKDYSIQAFVAGEWKEMDKISGNDKEMIAHKFSPVVTDRIRLWITAANGPDSKIAEIEIYEKQEKKEP